MTRDPIYKSIGLLIRERRKTLGWKQEVLAKALHISRGSLANIETGRQSILVHQLYRFALELQLSPVDLLPTPTTPVRGEKTQLPVPEDLKATQKQQIAEFFSQVDVNTSQETLRPHAKPSRR